MATGNAENTANGVTSVGGIKAQTRVFCDSNVDPKNPRVSVFYSLSPVTPLTLRSRLPFFAFTVPR